MLSPRRCTPGLQRFKISLGTCEHGPGFQSTTWWGMAYSDWTTGSSWWKKMPRYLPQDKSKVFSGICKEEEDKKEHNENYYWNWFSFFGNDLLNNLCTSPRLPSQPCCRIKRHLKECCGSFAASGQDVAHFVIFLSEKKKSFWRLQLKEKRESSYFTWSIRMIEAGSTCYFSLLMETATWGSLTCNENPALCRW